MQTNSQSFENHSKNVINLGEVDNSYKQILPHRKTIK